jgi:hypothetical protein
MYEQVINPLASVSTASTIMSPNFSKSASPTSSSSSNPALSESQPQQQKKQQQAKTKRKSYSNEITKKK